MSLSKIRQNYFTHNSYFNYLLFHFQISYSQLLILISHTFDSSSLTIMEQKPLDQILADRHEMPQLVPGKLLGHIPGLVSLEGNQDTIYVKNEPQVPQAHMTWGIV